VTVAGRCFPPNFTGNAVLTSDPVVLGPVRADAAGAFSATFTIPRNTAAGAHTITVSGTGASAAARITVTNTPLPATGSDRDGVLAGMALAVVFAGLVLLAGRRLSDQHEDIARRL
jgi:hypothetical protein